MRLCLARRRAGGSCDAIIISQQLLGYTGLLFALFAGITLSGTNAAFLGGVPTNFRGIPSFEHRSLLLLHSSQRNNNNNKIDASPRQNAIVSQEPQSPENAGFKKIAERLLEEGSEAFRCASIALEPFFKNENTTPEDIVRVCDELDEKTQNDLFVSKVLQLKRRALEFKRYQLLVQLLQQDYMTYTSTAAFLSPSRIPRMQLPNVQDVAFDSPGQQQQQQVAANGASIASDIMGSDGVPLVADCTLANMTYQDSLLDKTLLRIFRNLVEKNTGGVRSDKDGIQGLLEQGRTFMLQPNQTAEAQHKMVYDTLGGLMTPALPPFYRIFMSGILPNFSRKDDTSKSEEETTTTQLGPWFYAPWLTSVVTPTFFGFLVGPSRPNRRKDGAPGGLVVEKCKFLQESGCKGLCLNQCKLPAQQFFARELGLPLTVSPNFETQECQWSFGEEPLPPNRDPSFPKGCLVGCPSRRAVAGTADAAKALCN